MSTLIHYRDDFTQRVALPDIAGHNLDWRTVDFTLRYFTTTAARSYTASGRGGVLTNCRTIGDSSQLEVIFDNHGLTPGTLRGDLTLWLADETFPDGSRRVVIPLRDLDTTLTTTATTTLSPEGVAVIQAPLLRGTDGKDGKDGRDGADGTPGAPFRYEDFTAEQLQDLRAPAEDAAIEVRAEAAQVVAETREATAQAVATVETATARATEFYDAEVRKAAQRDSAAAQHSSAEMVRIEAEAERVSAEEARQSAESDRQSQLQAISAAETARSAAEAIRANAEEARQSAETLRQAAEAQRSEAEAAREAQFDSILSAAGDKQPKLTVSDKLSLSPTGLLDLTDKAKLDLFIDMWNEACGTYGRYNSDSGYFELNNLTDITYTQALQIYQAYSRTNVSQGGIGESLQGCTLRTLIPRPLQGNCVFPKSMCDSSTIETLRLFATTRADIWVSANQWGLYIFGGCKELTQWLDNIKIYGGGGNTKTTTINIDGYLSPSAGAKLHTFYLSNLNCNLRIAAYSRLTFDTVSRLVTTRYVGAEQNDFTIFVHPDVLAKLTGDETKAAYTSLSDAEKSQWTALLTLAAEKGIQFATI